MISPAERISVQVLDDDLVDLQSRLERTRWSEALDPSGGWRYGVSVPYLRSLVDYWRTGFDWRVQEAAMNRFEHWRVQIDGVPIHYLLRRGRGPAPVPIVLTHGWPWTFWDFADVIDPLADPAAYGGDRADAFDVVVPSLPGYGLSGPHPGAGITAWDIGELWVKLMTRHLGYERFAAHGGDWGAVISAYLAHAHADVLIGAHLTTPIVLTSGAALGRHDALPDDYDESEAAWAALTRQRSRTIRSHAAVHIHDPQTLALALDDSPVGLAAWLLERRRSWSDCEGDVELAFTRDQLLTSISLYWFTRTIGSSARLYADHFEQGLVPRHNRLPLMEAPTAICIPPKEVFLRPRRFVARHVNLQRWTVLERGGHFAAAEQPGAVIDDLRAFFRPYRLEAECFR